MGVKSWNKSVLVKYGGSPVFLITAVIAGSVCTYMLATNVIKPFFQRRKLERAKLYANFLIEQEEKKIVNK